MTANHQEDEQSQGSSNSEENMKFKTMGSTKHVYFLFPKKQGLQEVDKERNARSARRKVTGKIGTNELTQCGDMKSQDKQKAILDRLIRNLN